MVAARRPYGVVFPVLLILVGAMVLLVNLGTLPGDTGWRLLQLWPLLLVMLGVQLLIPHIAHGAAVPALTIALVAVIALGGFAYALAGPTFGTASYTRMQSSSPVAGLTEGTIRIDDAADRVSIKAGDIGNDLYQAKIDYVSSPPRFSYAAGDLRINRDSNLVNGWGRARDVVDLTVNQSVAWTVILNGAGTTTTVDLSNGRLASFRLNGAGGNVTIIGGVPDGAVRVEIDGVGIGLTLELPATAEYRVTAEGIGTSVSGPSQSSGWASAQDRYDVTMNGVGTHATVNTTG